jgi:hypothetical protein
MISPLNLYGEKSWMDAEEVISTLKASGKEGARLVFQIKPTFLCS